MASETRLVITPDTRVAALLDAYPQLEENLIALAPAFSKLRNPVLRRTVARVTSLRQASRVGNVSLGTLINALREAVGQQGADFEEQDDRGSAAPDWLDETRIADRLDARPMIESGEHPMGAVLSRLDRLGEGDIFQLTTPFVPAPLMDLARQRGYKAWNRQVASEVFTTYFARGV